jgi:superfamily II DNA or RNA helicase
MMELTKEQKQDLIQKAAAEAWKKGGSWGLLAMATGTGKSRIAVDEVTELYLNWSMGIPDPVILLVVPTEKLRDNNWEAEFEKWDAKTAYTGLQRYCYASLNKVRGQVIDLVILDEGHSLTEHNSQFFLNNSIKKVMMLSATPPDAKRVLTLRR